MEQQKQLGLAIEIATRAHSGQFDKGGKPYILHPLHLMTQLLFDSELAIIAVLHDVIEDSHGLISLETLKAQGFSNRVTKALELLTHRRGDDYLKVYIKNISYNYDAVRVKRKDLEHNSDITRLRGVSAKDLARIEKYHKAFMLLEEAKHKFEEPLK